MESGEDQSSRSCMGGLPRSLHASPEDDNYTSKRICRERFRIPCRARCLSHEHNRETAYIEIPRNAPHGMLLQCSHKECNHSGRRFRYCQVCKLPVAKRNFFKRHGHGMITNIQGEKRKTINACQPLEFLSLASLRSNDSNEITQSSKSHCPLSHLINQIFDTPSSNSGWESEVQLDMFLSQEDANGSLTKTEYDWGSSRRHCLVESGLVDDSTATRSTLVAPSYSTIPSRCEVRPTYPIQKSKPSGVNFIPSNCDIHPSLFDLSILNDLFDSNSNSIDDLLLVDETEASISGEFDPSDDVFVSFQENHSDFGTLSTR